MAYRSLHLPARLVADTGDIIKKDGVIAPWLAQLAGGEWFCFGTSIYFHRLSNRDHQVILVWTREVT